MRSALWTEWLGWMGMALVLLAYLAISFAWLSFSSPTYQTMNLVGSLGLIVATWQKRDYPPTVLNVFWCFIALFSLLRSFF